MKQSGVVPPAVLTRLQQDARAAYGRRDLKECVALLKQANRLAPRDAGILQQLGRIQGLLYDYKAAEVSFERAVRATPANRKAEALAMAGLQARDFYHTKLAERYFRRAVADKHATPDMLVIMAEFCERRRQRDEAAALVERALHLDARCPSALLVRGRLAHHAGRLEEAEGQLRSLLTLSTHPEVRARAGYELGAVLDRQGRYDEAMAAFLAAKSLLAAGGAQQFADLRVVRTHQAQLHEVISAETLRRWSDAAPDFQPPRRLAWLGGHPRSGTTLLEQVLDAHTDIVSAEETNAFFDEAYRPLQKRLPKATPALDVLDAAPLDLIRQCRADYFRSMDLCLGTALGPRLLIDKNPSLTVIIPGFVRLFPEIKLLVALRDPRDVVLSCFMQAFVPVKQISSAYLTLEDTAAEYAAVMGMWRTLAPLLPCPFLEVRYEDLVVDLESVARKTLNFLDVPWDARVLGFDAHARGKLVRSPTYADVTQKVFTRGLGRWRNYQKYLEPQLHRLEPLVKAFGYA